MFCFAINRDVVKHKLVAKENAKPIRETVTSTVKRTLLFPPLQDVQLFDYKAAAFVRKLKRTGASYLVVRILQEFRNKEGRDPSHQTRDEDLIKLQKIRNELAENLVDNSAFEHVFAQISPVAGIVGGVLSQEVIKAVSQKEAPHHNLFLFDPESSCGYVESIGN